jgi:hypothetical protein
MLKKGEKSFFTATKFKKVCLMRGMGIPLIQTAMVCCVGIATAFSVPPASLRLHAATTAPPRRVARTVCRPPPGRGVESAWRGADTALHCTGRACGHVYGGFHGQAECARRRRPLAAGRACARSLPGMREARTHARTHASICARGLLARPGCRRVTRPAAAATCRQRPQKTLQSWWQPRSRGSTLCPMRRPQTSCLYPLQVPEHIPARAHSLIHSPTHYHAICSALIA